MGDGRVVRADAFRGFGFDANAVRGNAHELRHIGADGIAREGPILGHS